MSKIKNGGLHQDGEVYGLNRIGGGRVKYVLHFGNFENNIRWHNKRSELCVTIMAHIHYREKFLFADL